MNSVTAASSSSASNLHLNRLLHEDALKLQNSLEGRLNNGAASTSRKSSHKHSPISNPFTTSSNLVTVMMDENKPPHDIEDHSFYMPLRRPENGHHLLAADYDEGKFTKKNYLKFNINSFFKFR